MTRGEHMAWCKERALEYLNPGPHYSLEQAVASMVSDLGKHEDTEHLLIAAAPLSIAALMTGREKDVRFFIVGFN